MRHARRARFEIRVKPGASRTHVGGNYGDFESLVVEVNAPAVDGKANAAVLAALAHALDVPRNSLCLVRGLTSRNKLIEYSGTDENFLDRVTQLRHSHDK